MKWHESGLALLAPNLTYPGRPLHGVGWPSLALASLGTKVAAAGSTADWAAWWGTIFNTSWPTGPGSTACCGAGSRPR
jgi:hypothetical protein